MGRNAVTACRERPGLSSLEFAEEVKMHQTQTGLKPYTYINKGAIFICCTSFGESVRKTLKKDMHTLRTNILGRLTFTFTFTAFIQSDVPQSLKSTTVL